MNLEKLTKELIAIESVTGDEAEILDFIENRLTNSEFTGEIIRNEGGIIAYHPSADSKIALVGHVDTVPLDKSQLNIDDDSKVYGRGSVDMKSGIAVMLKVMNNNLKEVVGVFYTAEEGPMLSLIHISEPTRPLYISYAVFCLKKKIQWDCHVNQV